MTVMDILLAADDQAVDGVLYGGDAAGRAKANTVFSAITQAGGLCPGRAPTTPISMASCPRDRPDARRSFLPKHPVDPWPCPHGNHPAAGHGRLTRGNRSVSRAR